MKLIQNALTSELFAETVSTINSHSNEFCWKPNRFFWPEDLMDGMYGSVVVALAPEEYNQKLIEDLEGVIPEFDELECLFCCFDRGSGIGVHSDNDQYKWTGTIYLNADWNINYGGAFTWKPKDADYNFMWRTAIPEQNLLVINDENEEHMVTPVSPYAKEERFTVQIWAK